MQLPSTKYHHCEGYNVQLWPEIYFYSYCQQNPMRWLNMCCETDQTNKHLRLNTLNMKSGWHVSATKCTLLMCMNSLRLSAYPDISCISVSDVGRPAAVLSVGLKVMEDFEHSVHGASHGSVWPSCTQPWLSASQEGVVQVGVQVGCRHGFPCWHCSC